MPSVRFRLRLFWYRLDKEACAFALLFGLLVGGLAFVAASVYAGREQATKRLDDFHAQNIACLARNIYFEARGEPLAGQYAVAEVTMNRVALAPQPRTVCSVVYQKSAFSWTDLAALPEPDGEAWERAQQVAEAVYYGRHEPRLEGALFYHADYVKPEWAKEKRRVARIGSHIFYR
jgi:spore germination cell wall hydrolase CwlJ-like protein